MTAQIDKTEHNMDAYFISEQEIVEKYREIAFGNGSKDSDRLRALEWLSSYAEHKKGEGAEMRRLDEILRSLSSSDC